MILVFHISIAMVSVLFALYTLFAPSERKLMQSYVLVGLTVLSGSYLIVSKPAHMLKACLVGLLYVGFSYAAIIVTKHKLAAQECRINTQ
jgi:hypothetical protein